MSREIQRFVDSAGMADDLAAEALDEVLHRQCRENVILDDEDDLSLQRVVHTHYASSGECGAIMLGYTM